MREGIIPVLVEGQQPLIGMYGASFLHLPYVLLLNDLFAKILKELGRRYYTRSCRVMFLVTCHQK